MKSEQLNEIARALKEAQSVYLFPHIQMDGDCLGSSAALCRALRSMGKRAYILVEDQVPEYLAFLGDGFITGDSGIIENPDVCMTVDCSTMDLSLIHI